MDVILWLITSRSARDISGFIPQNGRPQGQHLVLQRVEGNAAFTGDGNLSDLGGSAV